MGRSCTSIGAITYFKELFGSYGSPEMLYTDNGPQFDSYAFKEFAKRWSFIHTTSSPRYAQSNGFAERMVQTVKNTLRKAKMDDLDPDLALLCLRTTPISNKIRSPMELLMSRKGKANLPVNMRNQLPDAEQIGAAFRDRQDLQKRNYNLRAGTIRAAAIVCWATRSIPATTQQQMDTCQDRQGSSRTAVVCVRNF